MRAVAGERRVACVRAHQRRGRREREGKEKKKEKGKRKGEAKKEKEGERGKEITPAPIAATTASGRARAPVGRDARDEEE